jgi:hypothetical protein
MQTYQPTEYENCLIAAGWVNKADLDPEYVECQRTADEPMSYAQWSSCRAELLELNARWQAEIGDFYPVDDFKKERLANELLDEMCQLETLLGY